MTTASHGESDRPLGQPADPSDQPRRGRIPSDTFANRLVLVRRLAGMTIKEAAATCGLHYATWSTWEAGRRPADAPDVVTRIANELDIDREWLLFGGPLLPARGRPAKRVSDHTPKYLEAPVRRTSWRPTGRPVSGVSLQPVRRARVIDRSQLPAVA